jgi:hypothetical protein
LIHVNPALCHLTGCDNPRRIRLSGCGSAKEACTNCLVRLLCACSSLCTFRLSLPLTCCIHFLIRLPRATEAHMRSRQGPQAYRMIGAADNLLICSALFFPLKKSRRYARDHYQWREEEGSLVRMSPLYFPFLLPSIPVRNRRSHPGLGYDLHLTLSHSGPCIRGHRSSKCAHKDRVLVEVRKPGRPLSACPHPSGSCGCERAVVYAVPRGMYSSTQPETSLTRQSMPDTSAFFPPPLVNPAAGLQAAGLQGSRVQKPKARRSSSNVTPSTVQMVMNGDPSVLAQQANHMESSQATSEQPSNAPSLVSSSSSTPPFNAVDSGAPPRADSVHSTVFQGIKGENEPRSQLGMMGVGGYRASSDIVDWGDAWPDPNGQPASGQPASGQSSLGQNQAENETVSDGRRPAAIPEEPTVALPPSSCCAPKAGGSYDSSSHAQQTAMRMDHGQAPSVLPSTIALSGSSMNFSISFADPLSPSDARFGQFPGNPNFDFFSQYESRHGCSMNGQISSHINGGGEQHECHCGDGCMCLGCSQHPGNKTTQDYARYHNELASRGFNTQEAGMMPVPGFYPSLFSTAPTQFNPQMTAGPVPNLQQRQFAASFQQPLYDTSQEYTIAHGLPLQMGPPMHMDASANALQQFNFQSPMAPLGSAPNISSFQSENETSMASMSSEPNRSFQPQTEFQIPRPSYQDRSETQRPLAAQNSMAEQIPANSVGLDGESAAAHDSPSTDQDDNASILSQSFFSLQQVQIPGCDNITGTCHCGDGCECVGCLVHSGHSGLAGDNAVLNETSADTTRRLTEALQMHANAPSMNANGVRRTPDFQDFSLDDFQRGIHDPIFSTSVSG